MNRSDRVFLGIGLVAVAILVGVIIYGGVSEERAPIVREEFDFEVNGGFFPSSSVELDQFTRSLIVDFCAVQRAWDEIDSDQQRIYQAFEALDVSSGEDGGIDSGRISEAAALDYLDAISDQFQHRLNENQTFADVFGFAPRGDDFYNDYLSQLQDWHVDRTEVFVELESELKAILELPPLVGVGEAISWNVTRGNAENEINYPALPADEYQAVMSVADEMGCWFPAESA